MKTSVYDRIAAVRDTYSRIHSLTTQLGSEPSLRSIEIALEQRESLLDAICREREQLDSADPAWKDRANADTQLSPLIKEIDELIQGIVGLDTRLVEVIGRMMGQTKETIRSLYHSSRAASAYTAHLRPRGR
jgi:hypothetical protein